MAIEITGLSYSYANRQTPALRDVSLTCRAGEITLIAGRSGSGKSTLIRCVNGLIPQAYKNGTLAGEIRCFDESVIGMPLAYLSQRIGTVMQDPDKQIVATKVFNDIAFGLENLGLPRDEILKRVDEAANVLHIAHLLQRDTHSLSGGEQQKAVIAAVLAMQPRALLLDEPLASLDPPSAQEALRVFRRLADAGVAVMMIEHRVQDALRIEPEQCIELDAGEVVFAGDADAFRARHAPDVKRDASSIVSHASNVTRHTSTDQSVLSFNRARFSYPNSQKPQVNDVMLDVHAGDVMAVLGANGAGKSTLCRLAIGLLRPSAGTVMIDGLDSAGMTVARIVRKVGYVFQNPAVMLFANTLREELGFGPRNIGMSEAQIETAMSDAMQVVGLGTIPLDSSPFALSHGQQKRVALAAVLAMQPQVLILDEPTAGLDDATAAGMMGRLLESPLAPKAIILVTHDLRLARTVANRAVLLADGAVLADGVPAEVLADEAVMEQARLMAGELPVNQPTPSPSLREGRQP
jgi:energy-coupling factor transport system ATP-binding protein